MFENAIWFVVSRWVSSYIRNFRPEDLRVSLWNGHVQLNHVELSTEALNKALEEADIPLSLKRGIVAKLSISLPWAALLNESISIEIAGLALDFEPSSTSTSTSSTSSTPSTSTPSPGSPGSPGSVQPPRTRISSTTQVSSNSYLNRSSSPSSTPEGDLPLHAFSSSSIEDQSLESLIEEEEEEEISDQNGLLSRLASNASVVLRNVRLSFQDPSSDVPAVIRFALDELSLSPSVPLESSLPAVLRCLSCVGWSSMAGYPTPTPSSLVQRTVAVQGFALRVEETGPAQGVDLSQSWMMVGAPPASAWLHTVLEGLDVEAWLIHSAETQNLVALHVALGESIVVALRDLDLAVLSTLLPDSTPSPPNSPSVTLPERRGASPLSESSGASSDQDVKPTPWISVQVLELELRLTAHVEYPDVEPPYVHVVPRGLASVVASGIVVHSAPGAGGRRRIHAEMEDVTVSDVWSSKSTMRAVLRRRWPEVGQPVLSLSLTDYGRGDARGKVVEVHLAPLQVVVVPGLVARISSLLSAGAGRSASQGSNSTRAKAAPTEEEEGQKTTVMFTAREFRVLVPGDIAEAGGALVVADFAHIEVAESGSKVLVRGAGLAETRLTTLPSLDFVFVTGLDLELSVREEVDADGMGGPRPLTVLEADVGEAQLWIEPEHWHSAITILEDASISLSSPEPIGGWETGPGSEAWTGENVARVLPAACQWRSAGNPVDPEYVPGPGDAKSVRLTVNLGELCVSVVGGGDIRGSRVVLEIERRPVAPASMSAVPVSLTRYHVSIGVCAVVDRSDGPETAFPVVLGPSTGPGGVSDVGLGVALSHSASFTTDASMMGGTGGGEGMTHSAAAAAAAAAVTRVRDAVISEMPGRTGAMIVVEYDTLRPYEAFAVPTMHAKISVRSAQVMVVPRVWSGLISAFSGRVFGLSSNVQSDLEALSAVQVRWQYLALRLVERARLKALQGARSADGVSALRYRNAASWVRRRERRIAHWLRWRDLYFYMQAGLSTVRADIAGVIISVPPDLAGEGPRMDVDVDVATVRTESKTGFEYGSSSLTVALPEAVFWLAEDRARASSDGDFGGSGAVEDEGSREGEEETRTQFGLISGVKIRLGKRLNAPGSFRVGASRVDLWGNEEDARAVRAAFEALQGGDGPEVEDEPRYTSPGPARRKEKTQTRWDVKVAAGQLSLTGVGAVAVHELSGSWDPKTSAGRLRLRGLEGASVSGEAVMRVVGVEGEYGEVLVNELGHTRTVALNVSAIVARVGLKDLIRRLGQQRGGSVDETVFGGSESGGTRPGMAFVSRDWWRVEVGLGLLHLGIVDELSFEVRDVAGRATVGPRPLRLRATGDVRLTLQDEAVAGTKVVLYGRGHVADATRVATEVDVSPLSIVLSQEQAVHLAGVVGVLVNASDRGSFVEELQSDQKVVADEASVVVLNGSPHALQVKWGGVAMGRVDPNGSLKMISPSSLERRWRRAGTSSEFSLKMAGATLGWSDGVDFAEEDSGFIKLLVGPGAGTLISYRVEHGGRKELVVRLGTFFDASGVAVGAQVEPAAWDWVVRMRRVALKVQGVVEVGGEGVELEQRYLGDRTVSIGGHVQALRVENLVDVAEHPVMLGHEDVTGKPALWFSLRRTWPSGQARSLSVRVLPLFAALDSGSLGRVREFGVKIGRAYGLNGGGSEISGRESGAGAGPSSMIGNVDISAISVTLSYAHPPWFFLDGVGLNMTRFLVSEPTRIDAVQDEAVRHYGRVRVWTMVQVLGAVGMFGNPGALARTLWRGLMMFGRRALDGLMRGSVVGVLAGLGADTMALVAAVGAAAAVPLIAVLSTAAALLDRTALEGAAAAARSRARRYGEFSSGRSSSGEGGPGGAGIALANVLDQVIEGLRFVGRRRWRGGERLVRLSAIEAGLIGGPAEEEYAVAVVPGESFIEVGLGSPRQGVVRRVV